MPAWLGPALIYTLSIASLVWVSYGVNFRQVLSDIVSLDWRYVSVAVAVDLAVYLAHGWRWKLLLKPVARVSYWRSVQAIYIGLFTNEILPFRTGEVVRCYLLSHWNRFLMSVALSSAALERIMDGLWLIAAFFLTASFIRLPQYLVDGGQILAAALLGLSGLFVFIARRKHHAHSVFTGSRWAAGVKQTVEHIVEGLHAMGHWRSLLAAFGASFVYLFLQVVPVWALMEAYGLDLSFWAACAVLIVLRLGTVIPNAPGNAGVYQVLCVISLGLFGVDKTTAVGFSWTMFGVLTFPLLVGGFIAVLLTGLNLKEIRLRARSSMRHPHPAPLTAAEK
ncbi:MAG: flippase-like domain-containing protein [Bryobacterales bacterium]|nr:flippase-like domain-containing protein [Bryobacterales bacterium]